MLEFIILLSWFLHKHSDAYIVLGLLVFNALVGFALEQNAANAVEDLKKARWYIEREIQRLKKKAGK